jgi:hypothetical protein
LIVSTSISLVDSLVVVGVAVVLPLASGRRWSWWLGAGASVLLSFFVPEGWAGVFVLPFAVVAVAVSAETATRNGPLMFWSLADAASALACLYAVVAAVALGHSRFGVEMLGTSEPIVELTAVHFTYAGAGALALAAFSIRRHEHRSRLSLAAVSLTAAAPPLVAAGFVTHEGVLQVSGAVVMTAGVWLTAVRQLQTAAAGTTRQLSRYLLAISGLAVWVPMVLAVAWAAGQHWNVPALSIDAMARTHGVANAFGFVLCGLVGRHLATRPAR